MSQLGIGQPGLFYGGGLTQLGVAAASFVSLYVIRRVIGLRVAPKDEVEGLDLAEHGTEGYPELARGQLRPPSDVVVIRSPELGCTIPTLKGAWPT